MYVLESLKNQSKSTLTLFAEITQDLMKIRGEEAGQQLVGSLQALKTELETNPPLEEPGVNFLDQE